MNEAQFNFVFGFLVAMILFWFIPTMWRKVVPASIKSKFPIFNKAGGKKSRKTKDDVGDVEVVEPNEEDTEVDIQIIPRNKRKGNYKGRPKGAKNKPKDEAPEVRPVTTSTEQKRKVVNDFILPTRKEIPTDKPGDKRNT